MKKQIETCDFEPQAPYNIYVLLFGGLLNSTGGETIVSKLAIRDSKV